MTPKAKLFQASFSTILAIALLMLASAARAEVVTLVCQNELREGGSFTLRVDYDRKIVDMLSSDGAVSYSAAATITESNVQWKDDTTRARAFMGQLNRLSGQGNAHYYWNGLVMQMSGPCRRATQKF